MKRYRGGTGSIGRKKEKKYERERECLVEKGKPSLRLREQKALRNDEVS